MLRPNLLVKGSKLICSCITRICKHMVQRTNMLTQVSGPEEVNYKFGKISSVNTIKNTLHKYTIYKIFSTFLLNEKPKSKIPGVHYQEWC